MTEMAQVEGRTVPHNLDAERSVLGALLLHGSEEVIGEVSQALQADDFFLAPHRLIFRAILTTFDRVAHSDPITVAEELERLGSLAEAGGVLSPAGVLYHAEIVREKAMQRKLLETCLDIARCAYENATGTADLIDEAERRIFEIARTGGEAQTKKIGDVMMGVLERIDALRGRNQRVTGIATRYEDLDDYTSGLQPGELIVVAARPSMGKTSLALNLAERVASQGLGTAFFSLEMSSQQVIQNMLCARSQIDSMALRRGRVTEDQYRRVHEEAARLYDAPLFIDDSPSREPAAGDRGDLPRDERPGP
jgi:replicative DNA helicase